MSTEYWASGVCGQRQRLPRGQAPFTAKSQQFVSVRVGSSWRQRIVSQARFGMTVGLMDTTSCPRTGQSDMLSISSTRCESVRSESLPVTFTAKPSRVLPSTVAPLSPNARLAASLRAARCSGLSFFAGTVGTGVADVGARSGFGVIWPGGRGPVGRGIGEDAACGILGPGMNGAAWVVRDAGRAPGATGARRGSGARAVGGAFDTVTGILSG
mmetsp:Transcript_27619/g.60833  ORF Transcript_27619/g.60833 Transcript_27619/m.60833 type:complete len:213 (-) Transcript_27619:886-1524(-)